MASVQIGLTHFPELQGQYITQPKLLLNLEMHFSCSPWKWVITITLQVTVDSCVPIFTQLFLSTTWTIRMLWLISLSEHPLCCLIWK